jgi:hypothetical protein
LLSELLVLLIDVNHSLCTALIGNIIVGPTWWLVFKLD